MEKRKLLIGTYDTAIEGLWTLSQLSVSSPELRETYVEVPGRNGPLDLSGVLTGGEPQYGNRQLEATLESSEDNRAERERRISSMVNQLDGLKFQIILPDDPLHYLYGRVRVTKEYSDLVHAAVKVKATCEPWLYNIAETRVILEATADFQTTTIYNRGRKPVVPTIEVIGGEVEFLFNHSIGWIVHEGKNVFPEIFMPVGSYAIKYRTKSGSPTIVITYREAVLL